MPVPEPPDLKSKICSVFCLVIFPKILYTISCIFEKEQDIMANNTYDADSIAVLEGLEAVRK